MMLLLILIIALMAALAAVESADLIFSLILLAAFGVLMSAAFFLLGAVDLSILVLAAEIVLIFILIRATGRNDERKDHTGSEAAPYLAIVLSLAMMLLVLDMAYRCLPGMDLASKIGVLAPNPGPRVLDAAALFCAISAAVIGAFTLTREDK